jgi:hypothetical protein
VDGVLGGEGGFEVSGFGGFAGRWMNIYKERKVEMDVANRRREVSFYWFSLTSYLNYVIRK